MMATQSRAVKKKIKRYPLHPYVLIQLPSAYAIAAIGTNG